MPTQHPFDSVSDEITHWLVEDSKYYAEALIAGHQNPFSADVSEEQKLRYYERQLFNQTPDGSINWDSPNTTGRSQLVDRVGIDGYTQVMTAVLAGKGESAKPVPEEPEPAYSYEGAI